ncbi:MAG: H-NS histone family protein [Rubrivivax sp.]
MVVRVKGLVARYGITAADLGLATSAGTRQKGRAARTTRPSAGGAVKYRDESGHTWSGRGRRPQWFVDALAAGRTAADLLA